MSLNIQFTSRLDNYIKNKDYDIANIDREVEPLFLYRNFSIKLNKDDFIFSFSSTVEFISQDDIESFIESVKNGDEDSLIFNDGEGGFFKSKDGLLSFLVVSSKNGDLSKIKFSFKAENDVVKMLYELRDFKIKYTELESLYFKEYYKDVKIPENLHENYTWY
jgi:hypothetical protein